MFKALTHFYLLWKQYFKSRQTEKIHSLHSIISYTKNFNWLGRRDTESAEDILQSTTSQLPTRF